METGKNRGLEGSGGLNRSMARRISWNFLGSHFFYSRHILNPLNSCRKSMKRKFSPTKLSVLILSTALQLAISFEME